MYYDTSLCEHFAAAKEVLASGSILLLGLLAYNHGILLLLLLLVLLLVVVLVGG